MFSKFDTQIQNEELDYEPTDADLMEHSDWLDSIEDMELDTANVELKSIAGLQYESLDLLEDDFDGCDDGYYQDYELMGEFASTDEES